MNTNMCMCMLTRQKLLAASGATGWRSKLPGQGIMAETKSLRESIDMLKQFTTDELADHKVIQAEQKQRVAASMNKSITDVNWLLNQYQQQRVLQQWCVRRVSKGRKLPDDQTEMYYMLIEDKPAVPESMKPRQSPKGQRKYRTQYKH
jgi:signal recognition particle GTPase